MVALVGKTTAIITTVSSLSDHWPAVARLGVRSCAT